MFYGRSQIHRGRSRIRRGRSRSRCRGSSGRRRLNPRLLHGHGDEVVGAGGPCDLADGEREATRRNHGAGGDDHLVCLESSTHTPYLARHCRRNMVGSLPRGMPKVVDCR